MDRLRLALAAKRQAVRRYAASAKPQAVIQRVIMTFPKARLVVSACLFMGWLGFLAYLVAESRTIVLSKPQFLVAKLYVVVDVRDKDDRANPDVTVEKILWPNDKGQPQLQKL